MSSDSPLYDCEDEYDFEQDYELEYALDKEEKLNKERYFYQYESKPKVVENITSSEISPEDTSLPSEKPRPIVASPENVDELLPSLDLLGLFDEESEEDDSGMTGDAEDAAASLLALDLSDFDEKVASPIKEKEKQAIWTDIEQSVELSDLEPSSSLGEEIEDDVSGVIIGDEEIADFFIELDLSHFDEQVEFPIEELESHDSSTDTEQSMEISDPEVSSSLDEVYDSEDFFSEDEKKGSSDQVDHSEMYFDSDDEEYELSWADDIHVEVGGQLTQEDRAWQVAMEVAGEYELDQVETESLAEIFISNGWAACRIAMERELSQGTSLEELLLAAEVKEVWEEYPEYYNEFETAYRVMSWPLALSILRSFEGYPVIEEIEQMLLRLFEHWRKDKISTLIFRTFLEYLYDKFGHTKDCSEFLCEWKVEDAKFVEDGYFLPPRSHDIPPLINSSTPDKWLANVRRFNSY